MAFLKEKIELKVEEAELGAGTWLSQFPPLLRFVIVAAIVLIIPGYFISRSISKAYWDKKLQTNLITAHPSFQGAEGIHIQKVLLEKTGANTYAAAAYAINPNIDLSLSEGIITFNFYNSENELVNSTTQKFFLLPDQKKWIILPRLVTSQELARVETSFEQTLTWQKRLSLSDVRLTLNTPLVRRASSPLGMTATGSVTNNSPYLVKNLDIYLSLYNDSGQLVSVTRRTESDVKPFEKRDYIQSWPGLSLPESFVEAEADTNLLDPENLTLPQTQSSGGTGRTEPKDDGFAF